MQRPEPRVIEAGLFSLPVAKDGHQIATPISISDFALYIEPIA
ncbi:hypothetical protein KKY_3246 [Pelagibacterium halotolerans B2]|uniref:Uncharacterized protein n=1 Tax=Pelagibacterium halotolerans (strain DSM 22347 / JCM 15775 / CGMCC 1.7692 / B2) TaxID=1082931 RepID=G4R6W1_PELHB|nr:hypothetical protein KKY_3246 [Pelagibacterium halotolerans B2]